MTNFCSLLYSVIYYTIYLQYLGNIVLTGRDTEGTLDLHKRSVVMRKHNTRPTYIIGTSILKAIRDTDHLSAFTLTFNLYLRRVVGTYLST